MAVELKIEPRDFFEHSENTFDEDGGQYFMDQSSGQYYYQTKNGEVMLVVTEEHELDVEGKSLEAIETVSHIEGNDYEETTENSNENNTKSGPYQKIAIVPTDTRNSPLNSYAICNQALQNDKSNLNRLEVTNSANSLDKEKSLNKDTEKYLDEASEKTKTRGTTFSCLVNNCNFVTTKSFLLIRHMRSHSDVRPHICSVCDKGFKSLPVLRNHVNSHSKVKPYKCKTCTQRFTTGGELTRHVRYKHTHEKPHKCPDCDYASVELSKLKRHKRIHTGERPYACDQCTYQSLDLFKLKRHKRVHTGDRPYACDLCPASFAQSNSMKSHRKIHTGEKPTFQCNYCPVTCQRAMDIQSHIEKQHTAIPTILCKVCNKPFSDRYSLKMHKKEHKGQKCYQCRICPYAGTSERNLETHILLHTDEKPFQCDSCDQAFRQKQQLKRHQNKQHNPGYMTAPPNKKSHKCSFCGKSFQRAGSLKRHAAIHNNATTENDKQPLTLAKKKCVYKEDEQQNFNHVNNIVTHKNEFGKRSIIKRNIEMPVNGHEVAFDRQEQYSNAVSYKGRDGEEYLVLEFTDGPTQNNGASLGQDYSMHNSITMSEFLSSNETINLKNSKVKQEPLGASPRPNNYSTLEFDGFKSTSILNSSINDSISKSNESTATSYQSKSFKPSRFVLKKELIFDSTCSEREKDLATSFGFDSDEDF